MSQETVLAFTDGACLGNPGPGGYAALLRIGDKERELVGGEKLTTNNRMELLGAIVALEALKRPVKVVLHSDSLYVIKGMREWLPGWKKRGWKTAGKQPVSNRDLWERLERAAAPHEVHWQWVKGHAGHVENERVDGLATAEAARQQRGDVPADAADAFLRDALRTTGASSDRPGVETPSSDRPNLEAPSVESPSAHGQGVESPSTDGPGGETASTDGPGGETPSARKPRVAPSAGSAVVGGEATDPGVRARLDARVRIDCALAGGASLQEAPPWCLRGPGNTGVHCLHGPGEGLCPHATPSFALGELALEDSSGRGFSLDLSHESARALARAILRALGSEPLEAPAPPTATPRPRRKRDR